MIRDLSSDGWNEKSYPANVLIEPSLVDLLRERGVACRAASRHGDVQFDWDDDTTWSAAIEGIDAVYMVLPDLGTPEATDKAGRFAKLFARAGSPTVVLVATPDDGTDFSHAVRATERAIIAAGLRLTSLRLRWFYQNFSEDFLMPAVMSGALRLPAGDGREAFVDADDIAAVAVEILTDPRHDKSAYDLTGPRSMGFGEALAHMFHDLGNIVIIAGRRIDALRQAAAGRANIQCVELDVTDPQGIASFAGDITRDYPALNVLISNAGIMRYEDIGSARDLADTDAMITTNLLGPMRMIDALVEHLKAQGDAAIVNVSSGLAFVPLLNAAAYSAAKAGLHSYTISLREVLKGQIEVVELVPPAVQTGLTPGQESIAAFMPLREYIDEVMEIFAQVPTPAEVVVKRCEFLRNAEAESRFPEAIAALNQ